MLCSKMSVTIKTTHEDNELQVTCEDETALSHTESAWKSFGDNYKVSKVQILKN